MNNSEFYKTKRMFQDYLCDRKYSTYSEWVNLPHSCKVAALYLRFYNTIYTAWEKVRSFYTDSEEGVETILQYLDKNVPLIEANPQKYSDRYIYRVAYNCMYCICHDYLEPKQRYECVRSIYELSRDGDEFDLLDTYIGNEDSIIDQIENTSLTSSFWDVVESSASDEFVAEFVDRCIGVDEPYRRCKKIDKDGNEVDVPLRMSPKRKKDARDLLRDKLAKFAQEFGYNL